MLDESLRTFARCRSLALAAMISAGGKPCWVAAAAPPLPQWSRLELAWLRSVGRVPGMGAPAGGWAAAAAAAGYRPAAAAPLPRRPEVKLHFRPRRAQNVGEVRRVLGAGSRF